MNNKMPGSMMSLMNAYPEQEMGTEDAGTGPADLIQQAITLHEAHLDGSEPTSPESQQRLMDLLTAALDQLGATSVRSGMMS